MVLDKTRIAESDQSNLAYIERAVMNEMRCATLCKVTSVNSSNYTLTCIPLVKEKIRANNAKGYDYISLPELINVPYFTSGAASPSVGDMCVCIHLDRGISDILKQDIDNLVQVNCNNNRHDITDCVALVGFGKLSQSALQYVTTNTLQAITANKSFMNGIGVYTDNSTVSGEQLGCAIKGNRLEFYGTMEGIPAIGMTIDDDEVGHLHLSPTGDMYCDLRLGGDAGTSGQVLTSQGVGKTPTWTTPTTVTLNGMTTTTPSFWASESGSNISIGSSSSCNTDGVAVGNGARGGLYGVGIGANVYAYSYGVAIGKDATASTQSIAIGRSAFASSTSSNGASIAIGYEANASEFGAITIGSYAATSTEDSLSVGYRARGCTSARSARIGCGPYTSTGRALLLGDGYASFTYMNAAGSSWTAASDIRDKTDIEEIDHALDFIGKLKPITYVMNEREKYLIRDEDDKPILDENGKQQYDVEAHAKGEKKKHRRFAGLSAQDTYQAMLDCYDGNTNYAQIVDNNKYDNPDDEYIEQYSMSYERLVPFLIKAIQEQQAEIDELKKRLE